MAHATPAARGVYKPRSPGRRHCFGWCRIISTGCRRSTTSASPASTARGVPSSRRSLTSSWRAVSSSTGSRVFAVTTVRTNTARVLVQGPVLLPELPRQAPRDPDPVAGHDAPRARAASAGGAHAPQAAPPLLPVSSPPARRDRPRRRPNGHRRTLTGNRDLAVGIVACLQTHGARGVAIGAPWTSAFDPLQTFG